MKKQGNGASRNLETFWLHLKAKGRLETDYKFGIATFCSSKTAQKKHKLSYANVGGKKELDLDSHLHYKQHQVPIFGFAI